VLACLAALSPGGPLSAQNGAPYRDVVWPDSAPDHPHVLIDGRWLELLAFDGVAVADIETFTRGTYGDDWQRRFAEDMVSVLRLMGRAPGPAVSLEVRDPGDGRTFTMSEVQLTMPNRSAIVAARRQRAGVAFAGAAAARPPLTGEQVARELDLFQREIEGRWAYLRANGVDHRAEVQRLRERGRQGLEHHAFASELQKVVSLFIDGHAGVSGSVYPGPSLPFLIEATQGRYVALRTDRSGFVDADFPFIESLDGRPLAEWLSAAAAYVPKGSPQYVERQSLGMLRWLGHMRGVLGLPPLAPPRLGLVSRDGVTRREAEVRSTGTGVPGWPARQSGVFASGAGYLRLAEMDTVAVNRVHFWMPRFRETRGLIVDVRGNGGGSREALRALFPYLMSEGDPPRVVNAAKYRLHPSLPEDHMGGSRHMYREGWEGWSADEREAIARFKQTFTPEWQPPEAEFSDWHYLVMSRRMNPDEYFYDRPVIVLLDAGSFSATDIFLSALKGWRNVTLVGTPSSGGSALQMRVELPVSGLSVSLASMASFQRSGRLYDGNGVHPDVLLHPEPEYFLVGGRDTVLERAVEMLR
jgi:hypothetical protein